MRNSVEGRWYYVNQGCIRGGVVFTKRVIFSKDGIQME